MARNGYFAFARSINCKKSLVYGAKREGNGRRSPTLRDLRYPELSVPEIRGKTGNVERSKCLRQYVKVGDGVEASKPQCLAG